MATKKPEKTPSKATPKKKMPPPKKTPGKKAKAVRMEGDVPLNFAEAKVLDAVRAAKAPVHLKDIARKAFPGHRPTKREPGQQDTSAYRRASNAMRKLKRHRLAERAGEGVYRAA